MRIFKKTIFTGFAPNLTKRDILIALGYLFLPWKWFNLIYGKYAKLVEKKLREYFNIKHAYVFDSGRSALYFALKVLGAGDGVEVLVQAYTCVVVSNAINWTGAKPVYIDVGDDFNINPADLIKKITVKTKILIIQHTFGQPAKLKEILAIAKQHNLKIVDDCAQSLGATYQGKLIGTFGDIGMLSFGSDKIISCVRGGALITNDKKLAQKIKLYQAELLPSKIDKTLQHLFHFPVFFIGKLLYNYLYIGKTLLLLAKKLNIINRIIYQPEKIGKRVDFYPAKLPNALAEILNKQLDEINIINQHQQKIAGLYNKFLNNHLIACPFKTIGDSETIYLRYPVLTEQPEKLADFVKKHNIILGNWYNAPIAPKDINQSKTNYLNKTCPKAEALAKQSLNLPTSRLITEADAKKIIKIINSYDIGN